MSLGQGFILLQGSINTMFHAELYLDFWVYSTNRQPNWAKQSMLKLRIASVPSGGSGDEQLQA